MFQYASVIAVIGCMTGQGARAFRSELPKDEVRGFQDMDHIVPIGWRCVEYAQLSDRVRASLLAPQVEGSPDAAEAEPLPGLQFNLYRDGDPGENVQATVVWHGVREDLRRTPPQNLYFAVPHRVTRGEALRLTAADGSDATRIESMTGAIHPSSSGDKSYIDIVDPHVITKLLRHDTFEIAIERPNKIDRVGRLHLFDYAEAVAAYPKMLARLNLKLKNYRAACEAVAPPEITDESIV